jgi:chemosensory pili system protein ChpC
MTATIVSVPSLLIPLEDDTLLLPNAAVAEIVGYQDPDAIEGSPDWLLGLMSWRGYRLPLLSYESVKGKKISSTDGRVRIAIINTLKGNDQLPFFGIVTQGIPSLTQANQSVVMRSPEEADADNLQPGVLCEVLVHGNPAVIPDLDAIEDLLHTLPKESLGGYYADPDVESKKKAKK